MATQSEIGQFADEKLSNKIVLTEEDQKIYENWDFINVSAYQNEVVEFLRFEEVLVLEMKYAFLYLILSRARSSRTMAPAYAAPCHDQGNFSFETST